MFFFLWKFICPIPPIKTFIQLIYRQKTSLNPLDNENYHSVGGAICEIKYYVFISCFLFRLSLIQRSGERSPRDFDVVDSFKCQISSFFGFLCILLPFTTRRNPSLIMTNHSLLGSHRLKIDVYYKPADLKRSGKGNIFLFGKIAAEINSRSESWCIFRRITTCICLTCIHSVYYTANRFITCVDQLRPGLGLLSFREESQDQESFPPASPPPPSPIPTHRKKRQKNPACNSQLEVLFLSTILRVGDLI